jgi:uncharacterized protein (TIGR03118 family)
MFHVHSRRRHTRKFLSLALSLLLCLVMLPVVSSQTPVPQAKGVISPSQDAPAAKPNAFVAPGNAYIQTNLVSNIPGYAFVEDPLLRNPWGFDALNTFPFWINNNSSSTGQFFIGDVAGSPLVLNTGPGTVSIPGGLPTGVVANGSSDFKTTPPAGVAAPARIIMASLNGNITAWQTNNDALAQNVISNPAAVYTGLTIGSNGGGNRLYVTNFKSGAIEVFDQTFTPTAVGGGFADPTIPNTMGNTYHAFNIKNIGNKLYVMYAKYNPVTGKDVPGLGNGFVRRFNTDGVRDLTFGIDGTADFGGTLNSPWGIALAPATFGLYSSALIVGNFGGAEGFASLNAFNATTGVGLGGLSNEGGPLIDIDGLRGLQFGNNIGGDPNTLYFTAGFADEENGLFGSLKPTTETSTNNIQFAFDLFDINESSGHVDITVTREGNSSTTATVNFNTFDLSLPQHGSQKSDYEIAVGKITFNPGETSKTFRILIVNDAFHDSDGEVVSLALSNPTGIGVGLGSPNVALLRIFDDDAVAPASNPIDDANFFVRQHYLDFLNREPDAAGLNFWVNQITSCGMDAACIALKRINVSAAFFLSIEFQRTGLEAYLTHRAAFASLPPAFGEAAGVPVLYGTFERDTQALQKDFVVGQPGADAQIEANTQAYFADFVTRPEFVHKYPASLTNAQYVDDLLESAGLSPANFVVNLTNGKENPPTNPTTTGGVRRPASYGTATFTIDSGEAFMRFTATINNLDFTGAQTADTNDNLTNAHIHAGPLVTPTTNGSVVWGFIGSPFNDNNPNDQVVTPFVTGVGGTVSGKWDTPEGNNTTLTAQLANLREGRAYINFHTAQFGGGEIRGNFPVVTAFRDSLVAGLNGATETRATVLRKIAESPDLKDREFNRAFVFMQYGGYLRRDADATGYAFWLDKLNSFNGNFVDAEMVKAFILSGEYRQRFGAN